MLSLMSTLVDLAHLPITVSGGMPLDCLILCQNLFYVLLHIAVIWSSKLSNWSNMTPKSLTFNDCVI